MISGIIGSSSSSAKGIRTNNPIWKLLRFLQFLAILGLMSLDLPELLAGLLQSLVWTLGLSSDLENASASDNLLGVTLVMIGLFVAVTFKFLVSLLLKRAKTGIKFLEARFPDQIEWYYSHYIHDVLQVITASYTSASLFSFFVIHDKSNTSLLALAYVQLILICMGFIACAIFKLFRKSKEQLEDEVFSSRYGGLHEGIRFGLKITTFAKDYATQLISGFVIAWFSDPSSSTIQLFAFLFLNLISLFFLAIVQPYEDSRENRNGAFSASYEILILLMGASFLPAFVNQISSSLSDFITGIMFLLSILAVLAFLARILWDNIKLISIHFKLSCYNHRRSQERELKRLRKELERTQQQAANLSEMIRLIQAELGTTNPTQSQAPPDNQEH
jgi:hypothetical protein